MVHENRMYFYVAQHAARQNDLVHTNVVSEEAQKAARELDHDTSIVVIGDVSAPGHVRSAGGRQTPKAGQRFAIASQISASFHTLHILAHLARAGRSSLEDPHRLISGEGHDLFNVYAYLHCVGQSLATGSRSRNLAQSGSCSARSNGVLRAQIDTTGFNDPSLWHHICHCPK